MKPGTAWGGCAAGQQTVRSLSTTGGAFGQGTHRNHGEVLALCSEILQARLGALEYFESGMRCGPQFYSVLRVF